MSVTRGVLSGSSPRMRGTPSRRRTAVPFFRIIPAYAGNTRPNRPARPNLGDHPRVCGEHALVAVLFSFAQGSSPRMRGTPWLFSEEFNNAGIIPAYAGNTPLLVPVIRPMRDHPRVCGEHSPMASKSSRRPGSSPRMRGTRMPICLRYPARGIIPAYAGNTTRKLKT